MERVDDLFSGDFSQPPATNHFSYDPDFHLRIFSKKIPNPPIRNREMGLETIWSIFLFIPFQIEKRVPGKMPDTQGNDPLESPGNNTLTEEPRPTGSCLEPGRVQPHQLAA